MSSPLGRYAAPAAAIASLGIIGVYLLALVFGSPLGVTPAAIGQLDNLAFLAAGALFGSAVAVNGHKAALVAAHARLDAMGAPPATRVHEAPAEVVAVVPPAMHP